MSSKWNKLDTDISPWDTEIEYLPEEGISIEMEDIYGLKYSGYFLMSGEYTFVVNTGSDDMFPIDKIKAWKYTEG